MAYTPGPVILGGEWSKSTIADGEILQAEFKALYDNCSYFNSSLLPIGSVTGVIQGYFSDDQNGGFSALPVSIENHFYPCDGTAPNDSESPIWNAADRRVPNLTDGRFLMGATSAGGKGGSNDVIAKMPGHSHTHSLTAESAGNHRHDNGSYARTEFSLNKFGDVGDAASRMTGESGNRDKKSGWTGYAGDHSHAVSGSVGTGSVVGDSEQGLTNSSGTNAPAYLTAKYYIRIK